MRSIRPRYRLAGFAALLVALPLALWSVLPLPSQADPRLDALESRLHDQRAREQTLAGDVASLERIVTRLGGDIALLQQREQAVQAELDASLARLGRTRTDLRRERRRLAALGRRLAHARAVLGRQLVATYKDGSPDAMTVLLDADGFADLIERAEFLRRVRDADARVIGAVRDAKAASHRATVRLDGLQARQQRSTDAVRRQHDALASMDAALRRKQDSYARARDLRAAALRTTRGTRRALEGQVSQLRARLEREARQAASLQGPADGGSASGPWAIPWAIVQCESGGQNLPPNGAGASGYYQIIPSTWQGYGGSGPAAYLASKAEQDRVAAKIWNGGAGAAQWDCASIVHIL